MYHFELEKTPDCPCGTQRCYGDEYCSKKKGDTALEDIKDRVKARIRTSKLCKDILEKVLKERTNQDKKWGEQNHHDFVWNAILGEEMGEVSKEVYEVYIQGTGTIENLKKELIQVAAVAVAFYESIERREAEE